MGIMSLASVRGSKITLGVNGNNEDVVIEHLIEV